MDEREKDLNRQHTRALVEHQEKITVLREFETERRTGLPPLLRFEGSQELDAYDRLLNEEKEASRGVATAWGTLMEYKHQ